VQCRQLIGSDKLRPASHIEDYGALNKRLGLDFLSLIFAFNHIPLCLYWDRHSQSRRRASEFLAARKPILTGRLSNMIAQHF
jgi:hypothetical protein